MKGFARGCTISGTHYVSLADAARAMGWYPGLIGSRLSRKKSDVLKIKGVIVELDHLPARELVLFAPRPMRERPVHVPGTPLLRWHCTHRLGAWRGGEW